MPSGLLACCMTCRSDCLLHSSRVLYSVLAVHVLEHYSIVECSQRQPQYSLLLLSVSLERARKAVFHFKEMEIYLILDFKPDVVTF